MAGSVVYPKENRKGCKGFDEFGISFQSKLGALPTFVLVDRGDCFFALKIWNCGEMVNVNLDWREAVPHPDGVEYELWTNSNDECGVKCDMLMHFVKDFRGAAQILEKSGYTKFTPHCITWF